MYLSKKEGGSDIVFIPSGSHTLPARAFPSSDTAVPASDGVRPSFDNTKATDLSVHFFQFLTPVRLNVQLQSHIEIYTHRATLLEPSLSYSAKHSHCFVVIALPTPFYTSVARVREIET